MGIELGFARASRVLSTLAAAAVLVGCSGGDQIAGRSGTGGTAAGGTGGTAAGGTGGTGGHDLVAMFAGDFEAAFCAPLVTCAVFPDPATCEAFMDFAESNQIMTTAGDVGRGEVIYDPSAAAGCLAAVSQDCAVNAADGFMTIDPESAMEAFVATPACTGVFTGTLPSGADCHGGLSFECAPPLSSCGPTLGACNGACCPGVCGSGPSLTPHALGEDCTDNTLCALPAVCRGTCVVPPGHLAACASTMYPCAYLGDYCSEAPGANAATCLPRLAAGTPCTVPTYTMIDPCVMDAHCAANGAGQDVCVPLAGLGELCDETTNPCVGSLICLNATCTPTVGPAMDCGG